MDNKTPAPTDGRPIVLPGAVVGELPTLRGSDLKVLVVVASETASLGRIQELALKTGLSRRATFLSLAALRKIGLISRDRSGTRELAGRAPLESQAQGTHQEPAPHDTGEDKVLELLKELMGAPASPGFVRNLKQRVGCSWEDLRRILGDFKREETRFSPNSPMLTVMVLQTLRRNALRQRP